MGRMGRMRNVIHQ